MNWVSMRGLLGAIVTVIFFNPVILKAAAIEELEVGYFRVSFSPRLIEQGLSHSEVRKINSQLEELAVQLAAADRYYSDVLRLDPIVHSQGRFRGVSNVRVEVVERNRVMGAAGGGVIWADQKKNQYLQMIISSRWYSGNRTPEHEVFHLFQYAHSRIANKWYLEGMAGSMHQMFDGVISKTIPLPANREQLGALFSSTGDTSGFWRRIYSLCDSRCRGEGEKNIYWSSTANLCPVSFIKSFMGWLRNEEESQVASSAVAWARESRVSDANNSILAQGLRFAIRRSCTAPIPEELTKFDDELASFLERSGRKLR